MPRLRHVFAVGCTSALVLLGISFAQGADELSQYIKPGPLPPPRKGEKVALPFPPPVGKAAPTAPVTGTPPLAVTLWQPEGTEQKPPQISVSFNQPMVAVTSVGELSGASPVRIEPAIPGSWKWLGTSTIALTPKARIPYATRYTVTVPAGTRSASAQALAKAHVFHFDTPLPEATSFQPSDGQGEVGLEAPILVWFNQAVTAEKIAGHIVLRSESGATVSLNPVPRADWPKHEALKSYAQQTPGPMLAAFFPAEKLKPNTGYEITLRAGLVSDEGKLPSTKPITSRFRTYPPMAVRGLFCACGWGSKSASSCTVADKPCLGFNHPVKVQKPEDFVTVTPRPADLKLRVDYANIALEGSFRADTTYEVRVAPGLGDAYGQTLPSGWSATLPITHLPTTADALVENMALIEKNGALALPLRVTNAAEISVEAMLLPEDRVHAGLALAGRNPKDDAYAPAFSDVRRNRVAQWTERPRLAIDTSGLHEVSLRKLVAEHGAGTYLLVVDKLDRALLVQLTDIGITARYDNEQIIVLTTSIQSGRPLSGVKLHVVDDESHGSVTGTTGSDGVARLRAPTHDGKSSRGSMLVHATLGRDHSFVPASSYGDDHRGISLNWGHRQTRAYDRSFLYADRDLYRPGEVVHVFGIQRRYAGDQLDRMRQPESAPAITWTAHSSRDRELGKGTAPPSAFGTFAFDLTLPKQLDLGYVRIDTSVGSMSVQVQEYRAPEFEVGVKIPSQRVFLDEQLEANVSGRYLFGAPMRGAAVAWSLFGELARFQPAGHEDFHFGSAIERWHHHEHWEHRGPALVRRGKAQLDAQGRAQLRLPIADGAEQLDPLSLTLEAQVTDVSRQVAAGRASVLGHPRDRYVGLRMPQGAVEAKRATAIEAVLVDLGGARVAGEVITITASRTEIVATPELDDDGNATTHGRPKEISVAPCKLSAASAPQRCSLTFPSGGTYLVEATSKDAKQRTVTTRTYVEVIGKDRVAKRTDGGRLELSLDRREYQPGQTAVLTLRAPFSDGVVLLTEERRGVIGHRVVKIAQHTGTTRIQVREEHVPNLELGATGVAFRVRGERASWARGETSLAIARVGRTLKLVVRPEREHARPGEQLPVEVTVTDAQGRPVAARVSLVGVDEAVLGMSGFSTPDPLRFFHYAREAGVTLVELLKLLLPEDAPAKLAKRASAKEMAAQEDMAEKPSVSGAGARSAGGPGGAAATRRLFLTTPLAEVMSTAQTGKARFTLPVPDNLTRFRLMAVASDAGDRFGSGQAALTVSRPLQLRASLPRFINTSDAFTASVLVDNQGAQAGEAVVTVQVEGLELLDPPSSKITVPAGEARELGWQVRAPRPGLAKVRYSARLGSEADAVEVGLPIWQPASAEAFATYGTTEDVAVQPIAAPKDVLPGWGGLSITLASTALTGLQDAARYLVEYPYGCAEQISSRAMPLFALGDVVAQFGLGGPEALVLQKENARSTVDRLLSGQRSDGSWGTWASTSDEGRADLTAYIVLVLRRAQEAGFAVQPQSIQRASSYLIGWMARDEKQAELEPWRRRFHWDISALALYALGDWGEKHEALARGVYAHANELDTFARAMLAVVFQRLNPTSAERAALLREVSNRAIQTPAGVHFQEQQSEALQLLMHSSARTDAIVLLALLELEPRNPLVEKLVRGLMDARINGRWDTTQANAYALYAMSRYFKIYEAAPTAFSTGMWLGEGYLGEARFEARTMREQALEVPMQVVQQSGAREVTVSKNGSGRLYYRIGLRYAPKDLALGALDQGITVLRSYEPVEQPADVTRDKSGVWQIKAGSYVRVAIKLVVQDRRHYVVVDDPLPAGLELVNTEYKTSSQHVGTREDAGPYGRYTSWRFNHRELRDERSLHFADQLEPGTYDLTVIARATGRGSFVVPPTRSEEMYRPEVFGRTATDRMVIR